MPKLLRKTDRRKKEREREDIWGDRVGEWWQTQGGSRHRYTDPPAGITSNVRTRLMVARRDVEAVGGDGVHAEGDRINQKTKWARHNSAIEEKTKHEKL